MSLSSFIKDIRSTFILHCVASHFTNGLIPVAGLFLVLTLASGNPVFEQTAFHLLAVSVCFIPVSLISGIRDCNIYFRGAKAPIFRNKIILSVVLFLLGGIAIVVRLTHPNDLAGQGIFAWLYAGSLLLMLPVVILLGHYGGKLVMQVGKMK